MASLIVFSGPPGTGKSTLSYRLSRDKGWALLSKDVIDRALEFESIQNGRTSYDIIFHLIKLNLSNNVTLIIDAVMTTKSLKDKTLDLASTLNAKLYVVECVCFDEKIWKKRVESRPEMVEGWTPVGFAEAKSIDSNFSEWKVPHLVLDAVNTIDANYKKLLDYVG